ncbi:uncharacterized protein LOC109710609 [Ananas comosus]|uniref:Uncharacterized protein LOC109710609 n=1 Tax=Ananas comosus TaxID=4615 RepID=A0A6P5EZG9_ANACO|nr:uncharacterized protein LOC109710609 [Ananas comosus]
MDSNKAKRWIDYSRVSKEYLDGVEAFLNFAFENNSIDGKIPCPCQKCVLYYHQIRADVFDHLVVNGIMPGYDSWFYHGETTSSLSPSHGVHLEQKNYKSDDMVGMLHDAFGVHNLAADIDIDCGDSAEPNADDFGMEQPAEQFSSEWEKFKELLRDADEELYPGCRKFSKLSFILHLYNIKCRFGWSNESVGVLLKLLIDVFPEGAKLPSSFNEAKKIIEGLGMKYNKIHACPNDCMLFWKEKENDDFCSICGTSRWKYDENSTHNNAPILKKKKKSIPAKVLRHFPIKPRLQRLFMSSRTSDFMTWHEKGRIKDGVLRHPADSEAWKNFDSRYPKFAIDPRNVRLGLATDGFNPYGTMRSNYSIWPVILIPYNLPPWLCMKQPNFILSLLIPGPKGPGNDIDVYLQPLVEELIELWEVGVETYDASCKKTFQMHTAVMWTINDFPAYGNLSGWSTYGSFACPSCNVETCSVRLKHSKKFCFMGHRRFLDRSHKFRYDQQSFDGTEELRLAPPPISGSQVLDQVNSLEFTFGKMNKKFSGGRRKTWRKKSIFFKLPYWEYNLIRHNLDVMHIEKNVNDNVLNTIMNDEKKSKDNLNARRDLQEMRIREEFWPQEQSSDGHASNVSRCVVKKRKLSGLKSHDCHVIMQELLPLALRGNLPEKVSMARLKELNKIKIRHPNNNQLHSETSSQNTHNVQPSLNSHSQSNENQLGQASRDIIDELQNEAEQAEEKRARGPTLLTEIWNLPKDERITVNFNTRWQPIGNEGRVLASFLGIMARNANLTPLHIPDWRAFPKKEKKRLFKLVESKFLIPPRGEKWVLRSLGKKWKDYKCELKGEYYLKYKNVDDVLEHKPERVPRDQWTSLVSFWNSEKVKKRSEKNRENRAKQKMPHTAGSKSFARLMAEKAKDGVEPSRAHIFIETHKPRKDGRSLDEESAQNINSMKQKMEKLPNSVECGNRRVAWEGDIFSQVIGPERHGQVRGLGLGPTPTSLWAPSSSNQISSRDCERVEQLEKEIKMMEQHHANEMKAMRENQVRLDSEIALMRSIINRRFPEEVLDDSSARYGKVAQNAGCSSSFSYTSV